MNNKWISVQDRLPIPHKQRVLVALKDGSIEIASDWLDWPDGTVSFEVAAKTFWIEGTYWMPLPEFPKES